jgi:hypothetical protein
MNDELYKLTKIGVKNSDSKYLSTGDVVVGPVSTLPYPNDKRRLVVGNLITSFIQKYTEEVPGKSWTVETENSVYTLEKL